MAHIGENIYANPQFMKGAVLVMVEGIMDTCPECDGECDQQCGGTMKECPDCGIAF